MYFRDSETGLDYADQRYHNPGTGRFLVPDRYMNSAGPADPGSWNRYAYVGGDPTNRVDPGGTCWIEIPYQYPIYYGCGIGDGSGDPVGMQTQDNGPSNGDGAPQGGGYNDPAEIFKMQVQAAKSLAETKLLQPSCLNALFGGAPGVGPNSPGTVLSNITVQQTYSPDANTIANPGKVTILEPDASGSFTATFQDAININSNPAAAWNSGYVDQYHISTVLNPADPTFQTVYQAMTLIHELAHIWAANNGLTNGFQLPDNETSDMATAQKLAADKQQIVNQDAIYKNCFK